LNGRIDDRHQGKAIMLVIEPQHGLHGKPSLNYCVASCLGMGLHAIIP
jgi:hypothetical protein